MRKLFFLTIIFISIFYNTIKAEQIKNIEVVGNKRISKETILVFGGIELNKDLTTQMPKNNQLAFNLFYKRI